MFRLRACLPVTTGRSARPSTTSPWPRGSGHRFRGNAAFTPPVTNRRYRRHPSQTTSSFSGKSGWSAPGWRAVRCFLAAPLGEVDTAGPSEAGPARTAPDASRMPISGRRRSGIQRAVVRETVVKLDPRPLDEAGSAVRSAVCRLERRRPCCCRGRHGNGRGADVGAAVGAGYCAGRQRGAALLRESGAGDEHGFQAGSRTRRPRSESRAMRPRP